MNHNYTEKVLTVDINSYPTILITINDINPTDEQVKEGIILIDRAFSETSGSCCMIGDGSKVNWVDARARMLFANGIIELEKKYAHRVQFAVMVVPNPTVNMLLKGLNLIAKPVIPQILVKTLSEATKIVQDQYKPET